ncbi:MAG: Holliday junction resolvase RuvX [Cyanobacteria bacterium QS_8_64_29]|nr:MAG: Holliday junction resolvase RuvX [Cyanobacteria bacterium QS_8_64_29]
MPERVSALGLDVGKRRLGVAGCDGMGLIATGLTTIERQSFPQDRERLQAWVAERRARVLVVGLPYCMDGTLGEQARQVQQFAQRLAKTLEMPLDYVDERLSSLEAREQLNMAAQPRSRADKARIDCQAAAIILQQWLDRRR